MDPEIWDFKSHHYNTTMIVEQSHRMIQAISSVEQNWTSKHRPPPLGLDKYSNIVLDRQQWPVLQLCTTEPHLALLLYHDIVLSAMLHLSCRLISSQGCLDTTSQKALCLLQIPAMMTGWYCTVPSKLCWIETDTHVLRYRSRYIKVLSHKDGFRLLDSDSH